MNHRAILERTASSPPPSPPKEAREKSSGSAGSGKPMREFVRGNLCRFAACGKVMQSGTSLSLARRRFFVCLALALLTFAAYWPLRSCGFTDYDDPGYVTENAHINAGLTWQGFLWVWSSEVIANWHPVTMLSHMLDCQIFGASKAMGHHFMNLAWHIANALLLFLLLERMTGKMWRSAAVVAFFALHPLRVESVAWVAERKDVLSGFFFMLTLWAYVQYVSRVDPPSSKALRGTGSRESRARSPTHLRRPSAGQESKVETKAEGSRLKAKTGTEETDGTGARRSTLDARPFCGCRFATRLRSPRG